jgi:hypothetical protein
VRVDATTGAAAEALQAENAVTSEAFRVTGSEEAGGEPKPRPLDLGFSRPLLPWSGNRSTEPVDVSVNNLHVRYAEVAQLLHSRCFA